MAKYVLGLDIQNEEYLIPSLTQARTNNLAGGYVTSDGEVNDILFGDGTWAGASTYVILNGGSSSENI